MKGFALALGVGGLLAISANTAITAPPRPQPWSPAIPSQAVSPNPTFPTIASGHHGEVERKEVTGLQSVELSQAFT